LEKPEKLDPFTGIAGPVPVNLTNGILEDVIDNDPYFPNWEYRTTPKTQSSYETFSILFVREYGGASCSCIGKLSLN
jgi:hypothetical protein